MDMCNRGESRTLPYRLKNEQGESESPVPLQCERMKLTVAQALEHAELGIMMKSKHIGRRRGDLPWVECAGLSSTQSYDRPNDKHISW